MKITFGDRYWLKNAHIPLTLLQESQAFSPHPDGLAKVHVEIKAGKIVQIVPVGSELDNLAEEQRDDYDVRQGIILPCFVDVHTHLDKGFIWARSPNLDGTFAGAIKAVARDTQDYWRPEDLYRRMEFGLKCSYGYGTQAVRTHLDCGDGSYWLGLEVFKTLQQEWRDKITLQGVSLVSLESYQTPAGVALADRLAELGETLGAVVYSHPHLEQQLETLFRLATERGLNLDLHTDENGDPDSISLFKIAQAAIRHQFQGQIVGGHCCSLAVQSPEAIEITLQAVKEAKIGIISLPMCNLFLQDRVTGRTPRWRGITLVQEFKQRGIPVAFASDNSQDPFFAFGDMDVLEVFNQGVRIGHLDRFYSDWITSVTATPAAMMGLTGLGTIAKGKPANLIIFKGRTWGELLSRSQFDRIVLRNGQAIDTSLPDYAELDP